jgi:hypothetical protein
MQIQASSSFELDFLCLYGYVYDIIDIAMLSYAYYDFIVAQDSRCTALSLALVHGWQERWQCCLAAGKGSGGIGWPPGCDISS